MKVSLAVLNWGQKFVETFGEALILIYTARQVSSFASRASLNVENSRRCRKLDMLLLNPCIGQVLSGTMTVGDMVMINGLLMQMMGPLDHLGNFDLSF